LSVYTGGKEESQKPKVSHVFIFLIKIKKGMIKESFPAKYSL
jgi:hypothetical protein